MRCSCAKAKTGCLVSRGAEGQVMNSARLPSSVAERNKGRGKLDNTPVLMFRESALCSFLNHILFCSESEAILVAKHRSSGFAACISCKLSH